MDRLAVVVVDCRAAVVAGGAIGCWRPCRGGRPKTKTDGGHRQLEAVAVVARIRVGGVSAAVRHRADPLDRTLVECRADTRRGRRRQRRAVVVVAFAVGLADGGATAASYLAEVAAGQEAALAAAAADSRDPFLVK